MSTTLERPAYVDGHRELLADITAEADATITCGTRGQLVVRPDGDVAPDTWRTIRSDVYRARLPVTAEARGPTPSIEVDATRGLLPAEPYLAVQSEALTTSDRHWTLRVGLERPVVPGYRTALRWPDGRLLATARVAGVLETTVRDFVSLSPAGYPTFGEPAALAEHLSGYYPDHEPDHATPIDAVRLTWVLGAGDRS